MSRPIGAAGLALIQQFEGCRLTAYKALPTEPYWTIGWGHYGPDVQEGDQITQAEADALLVSDCQRFADTVDNPAYCPLTAQLNDNQRDALISFTFNCGAGCLKTLCKGRTLAQICSAMALYQGRGQGIGRSDAPQGGGTGTVQYARHRAGRGGDCGDIPISEGRAGDIPARYRGADGCGHHPGRRQRPRRQRRRHRPDP